MTHLVSPPPRSRSLFSLSPQWRVLGSSMRDFISRRELDRKWRNPWPRPLPSLLTLNFSCSVNSYLWVYWCSVWCHLHLLPTTCIPFRTPPTCDDMSCLRQWQEVSTWIRGLGECVRKVIIESRGEYTVHTLCPCTLSSRIFNSGSASLCPSAEGKGTTIQQTSLMAHSNSVSLSSARQPGSSIYSAFMSISALRMDWVKDRQRVGSMTGIDLQIYLQQCKNPLTVSYIPHHSNDNQHSALEDDPCFWICRFPWSI